MNRASGHSITKIDDDFYSISTGGISHGLSGGAPVRGGGEIAAAGPVTVSN